jgi:hypothetical protein
MDVPKSRTMRIFVTIIEMFRKESPCTSMAEGFQAGGQAVHAPTLR